ncbi:MAG: phosphoenolpyruvate--protein phosphotransferase [Oscillospiraceae bacterium]|nr:phosphoenolpyruvate--protein phosphotransferase [Oscillospiraceae bacterium]
MIGAGVVDGIAIQKVFVFVTQPGEMGLPAPSDARAEHARFAEAVRLSQVQLEQIVLKIKRDAGEEAAGILEYQILILEDDDFLGKIRGGIEAGQGSEAAVRVTCTEYAEFFRHMDNDYLKQRCIDILDIQKRLLDALGGRADLTALDREVIVAASDLTPSQVAEMENAWVKGILLENGGASSHSIILARSLSIPCVIGLSGLMAGLCGNETVIMDGATGEVIVEPSDEQVRRYQAKRAARERDRALLRDYIEREPVTLDGRRVGVYANISSQAETGPLLAHGGEGVGLLRTELLYMTFEKTPSREAQYGVYAGIAKALGGRPLVVRTLDVGGDKHIEYLGIEPEENPFLGYRAIRYCLDHPALFEEQIAAILMAADAGDVRVMFPMIATVDELLRARRIVEHVERELAAQGAVPRKIPIGMMVEVPSVALMAEAFARHVDFFSIGTNDLTQYLFAADRSNKKVAHLNNSFHPALLRCVEHVCAAACARGIEVEICGQAGETPELIPLWIAMGVSGLSVSIPTLPLVRKVICETDAARAKRDLETVLTMESAEDVARYLHEKTKEDQKKMRIGNHVECAVGSQK